MLEFGSTTLRREVVCDAHVQALDYAVYQAQKHNMRLVMSLVNNYDSYGGKPQYAIWGRQKGLNLANDDAFYTNAMLRTWYKNHVKVHY